MLKGEKKVLSKIKLNKLSYSLYHKRQVTNIFYESTNYGKDEFNKSVRKWE